MRAQVGQAGRGRRGLSGREVLPTAGAAVGAGAAPGHGHHAFPSAVDASGSDGHPGDGDRCGPGVSVVEGQSQIFTARTTYGLRGTNVPGPG